MPLIMILAECGLEIVPNELRNHPSVKNAFSERNYGSQLLDTALHHSAMKSKGKSFKDYEKRGRPDIAHLCLLNALGSPLNKWGKLKFFLHTYNNKIFEFNPEIRIAKNFNRFKGLMAKLLIEGSVSGGEEPLISSFDGGVKDLIETFEDPEIMLLSHKGALIESYSNLFKKDIDKNIIVVIGGFQKSTFSKDILKLSDNLTSISGYPLETGIVVSKVINFYEIIHEII